MSVKPFFLHLIVSLLLVSFMPMAHGAGDALSLRPRDAHVQPFLSRGNLYQKGENAFFLAFSQGGTYTVQLSARGDHVENAWPELALAVNGIEHSRIRLDSDSTKTFSREVQVAPGVHKIGFMLLNEAGGFFGRRTAYLEGIQITSPSGGALPTLSNEKAWNDGGPGREAPYIEGSRERIEGLRMGDGTLRILDGEGNGVPDLSVSLRQTRHAFLFGGLLAGFSQYPTEAANKEYRDRFAEIFNYATLPFYWALFEPEPGKRKHEDILPMLEWCEARNITTKGHTLLWDNEAGIPPWSKGQPPAATQEAFVREIMTHYKGRIPIWEVVNEPANHPGVSLMPAHRWAREADPEATLVVNEYGIFYEGHPAFWDFLKDAIESEVPFDAIGIQAHAPINMAFPLDRVWHILDHYQQLGKAIHITEFTPASNNTAVLGSPWRGRWSEAQQADYAEAFYRVCFAHPAVEAITWWDFADTGAWVTGGGMLRSDRSPKPVFERLRKLIKEEWHTEAQLTTDENGTARFNGFYGDYEITYEVDGEARTHRFTHTRDTTDHTLKP